MTSVEARVQTVAKSGACTFPIGKREPLNDVVQDHCFSSCVERGLGNKCSLGITMQGFPECGLGRQHQDLGT